MSRSTPTLTGPMLLPLNLPLPWVPQIRAPSRKHFTLPLAYPCLCLFAAYPDLDVHRFAESLTLLQKCPRPSVPIQPCPLLVVPCSLFVLNVASLDVGPLHDSDPLTAPHTHLSQRRTRYLRPRARLLPLRPILLLLPDVSCPSHGTHAF